MILYIFLILLLLMVHILTYQKYYQVWWYFYKKDSKIYNIITNSNLIYNLILLQEILQNARGSNIKALLQHRNLPEAIQHIDLFLRAKKRDPQSVYFIAPEHQGYDSAEFNRHDFLLIKETKNSNLLKYYEVKMRTAKRFDRDFDNFIQDYSRGSLGNNKQGCRPRYIDHLDIGTWTKEDYYKILGKYDFRHHAHPEVHVTNKSFWYDFLIKNEANQLDKKSIISPEGLERAGLFVDLNNQDTDFLIEMNQLVSENPMFPF